MRLNPAGLGATLALHLLAMIGLLTYEPARHALLAAAPIMVDLLVPLRVDPPRPPAPAEPPKPRPVVKRIERPLEPAPVLTASAEAPAMSVAPPPPPPPPAPVEVVAPPAPVLTQPIFNADYLDNPAPAYPALSRRLGEQGRLVLRVLVNARGGADEVLVRISSGHARLDDMARDTVRRWRFVPAKRGDQPVAAWVLIPISFRLEG